jgi:hypothetical protein
MRKEEREMMKKETETRSVSKESRILSYRNST